MVSFAVSTLSLPPGAVTYATNISGSTGFGVVGHVPEIWSLFCVLVTVAALVVSNPTIRPYIYVKVLG